MTHTQTVMLRLLTMCIPFRNLRKKWRTFLRDFLSDYDRDARRSMRAWRRHPVAGRTILILEPNYCHGEVIPGFCRHLLDMGYRVDVLMHHSLARQSPLCCFKEGDIHIFTAMCTSWKRLAKARVLTRYEAILISTSAFYDIPGWASFLHMTGLDKFANLLAVEHELKEFVSQLSKRCRFLILATSTSIMDGPDGTLNEEKEKIITAFNAIVREAASSLPGAVLSDHHDFMQGRRYIDPFHFSPPDRAYQAGKTAGLLLPLLSARQEPPKEQECPQSRPEP